MTLATAGNVLVTAADISGYGPVRTLSGLANDILDSANSVRVNSRTALAISQRVAEMSRVIASLLEDDAQSADAGRMEPLMKFSRVLSDVNDELRTLGKKSYLSQLLHQQRDKENLLRLSESVRNAFQVLTVQLRIQTTVMARDLEIRMETLAAAHVVEPELPSQSPIIPAAQLPPNPALHFGRASETEAVVNAVAAASFGRVAILGSPGIGKTTLSLAVLHHQSVVDRFGSQRFFVPCDAAEGQSSCLITISDAFGIASSDAKLVRFRLREIIGTAPAVIVLDNFESAWELAHKRQDAEHVLQFLDSIANLSLILTLRGSERPQQVRWSRPFFPPLAPLSEPAAKQTFQSIADLKGFNADAALDVLIGRLDNVPLAVVLMANLAQVESAETLLLRWDMLETAMLVRGNGQDRLSSLDVSITLSLRSPRMQSVPAAQHLLSVLSLLPGGVVDTDIDLWNIPHSARALSALSQNSLVLRSADQRIYVLAPIRSFMLTNYCPSEAGATPVFSHYFGLAQLAEQFAQSATKAHVSAIASELANIDSVIRHVFNHSQEGCPAALKAVSGLCSLYEICGMGSGAELLSAAVRHAKELGLDNCRAELLVHWARISDDLMIPGDPKTLLGEARDIYERLANEERVVECSLRLLPYLPPNYGVLQARRLVDLVSPCGDSRLLARCAAALAYCLRMAGKPRESTTQCELAIAIMHAAFGPDIQDNVVGNCKYRIAQNLSWLGDYKGASKLMQDALSVFEATHFAQGVQSIRWQQAELFWLLGQPLKTLEVTDLLLAGDTPGAGDFHIHVGCLTLSAIAHAQAGDVDAAMAALAKFDQLTVGLENTQVEKIQALSLRSDLGILRGEFAESRALLQVAFTIARGHHLSGYLRSLDSEAVCLVSLGEVECAAGRLDESAALMVRAAILYRSWNDTPDCVRCLTRMAEAVDDDFAERLVEATLLPLQWMGLSHDLAILQLRSATIARNRGQHQLARKRARNALRYFGEIKGDWRISIAEMIAADE